MDMEVSHTVYFDADPSLSVKDRLRFDSRNFQIVGFKNTDELDRLFVADCLELIKT